MSTPHKPAHNWLHGMLGGGDSENTEAVKENNEAVKENTELLKTMNKSFVLFIRLANAIKPMFVCLSGWQTHSNQCFFAHPDGKRNKTIVCFVYLDGKRNKTYVFVLRLDGKRNKTYVLFLFANPGLSRWQTQ